MRTMNNPGLNAKLKAMYAQKLKKEDLEDLIKQNNLTDAIILLKSKLPELDNLSDNAKRMELETALDTLLIYDIQKILKYLHGANKEIFTQYIIKYKIETIKKLYENIDSPKVKTIQSNDWIEHIFTDLKVLYTATSKEDFIDKIPDKNIKSIFENSHTDFERENTLDKYYFENLFKTVKGKNKKIETLLNIRIDLLNILWTYRCKKYYGIVNQDILIPHFYKIDLNTIQKIENANTLEDLNQALAGTIYQNMIGTHIESDIKKYVYQKSKKAFRNELLDLSMIISYFKILETEKENIVTIIEGIRYKMSKPSIESKIII